MPQADWSQVFALSVSPLELIVRGSAIYLFLFAVFRFVMRRDLGSVGVSDVLILVLVADAAQNGMAGEYKSISDGLILVSTILAWNFLLDWLCYRSPAIARLLQPRELLLVSNGRIERRGLRREYMTVEELMSKLREHGIADVREVESAHMEGDGQISVVKKRR